MVEFHDLERADRARTSRARLRCPTTSYTLTTDPARALGSRRGRVFVREAQCHESVALHTPASQPAVLPAASPAAHTSRGSRTVKHTLATRKRSAP